MNPKSSRYTMLPVKLSQAIEETLAQQGRFILALDGMAASGKSRLAVFLRERYGGSIIHIDDFYLPLNERDLSDPVPGPHIDKERFQAQVLTLLANKQSGSYDKFDCHEQAIVGSRWFEKEGLIIVEGAYALLPQFGHYYDQSVCLTIDSEVQQERLYKREGDTKAFHTAWLPLEKHYREETRLIERADFEVDASATCDTVVYFVRHGATDNNVNEIIQGQIDIKLGEHGVRQAEALAERLKDIKIDRFISSDLSRALATSEILRASRKNIPLISSSAWREMNFGLMQGKTYDYCFEHFEHEMETMKNAPTKMRSPNGETADQVRARIESALNGILRQYENEVILIVTHSFVLNLLFQTIAARFGVTQQTEIIRNSAISRLTFCQTSLRSFDFTNNTQHLKSV